jgi:tight adherence protein C
MLIIGAILIFAAIFLAVMGLARSGESPMSARLAGLRGEEQSYQLGGERTESVGTRVLIPLLGSLTSKLEKLLPTTWIKGIEQQLVQAGEPISLKGFLTIIVVAEGGAAAFGLVIASASGLTMNSLGMIAVFLAGGVLLPKMWLSSRAGARRKTILKSLPDAFDLITVCVESGLGLDAAMARVAEKVEGPFGEELAITLREVSLGKLRREALRELADRISIPDLSTFITAVIQAETMGTSIATVLRIQAEQMRVRRRQRAEQQAQQAPVKMVFPLVLCIFPTLFLLILGPAMLSIIVQLGGR